MEEISHSRSILMAAKIIIILLHDLQTAEQMDLTPNVSSSLQANFAWSPDSQKIAFISDQSGQFDVYVIDC